MKEHDYTNITTPLITGNDCEGAGHVFSLVSPFCQKDDKFFNGDAFLSVSGQLHLEAMIGYLYLDYLTFLLTDAIYYL